MQSLEEKIQFLKNNIEPLNNSTYGVGYRAAVYLTDGTYLPCVIFRNPKIIVELAIKRFKEENKGGGIFRKNSGTSYHNIVKNFVTSGNCINEYDIDRIEKSPFAFPLTIQKQIEGETTMGWTGFAAKMKDGNHIGFGTRFFYEFFDIPQNYSTDDIIEIINHSYVLKNGELRSHDSPFLNFPDDYKDAIVNREKLYFQCYIDNL